MGRVIENRLTDYRDAGPVGRLVAYRSEADPKQLLFVGYDLKAAEPRPFSWLIDSDFYRAHANLVKGYYKAGRATKATAADKWVGTTRATSRGSSRRC